MNKPELLAPAGNFDCMVAAVQSGADAVYLAGTNFGARSFADNFDAEHLEKAIDYCHLRGVKVYVTVNTLVADSELEELKAYLCFLSAIGTDAIIVQDMGVVSVASEVVPELPVHASTQMTIHNKAGVEALVKMGIKRVVLSRELSIEEIEDISQNCDIELEVFVHGALCMCYSGQCLFSSIIGGRSGNRGKCAQPCRLPYSANENGNKKFLMSLKDLCGLESLYRLKQNGVASLKIEGRMKGTAYVAAVVKVYRKYIDEPQNITSDDIALLDSVFNRGGLTNGYLEGKTGSHMFALDKPDNPYLKGDSDTVKNLVSCLRVENRKLNLQGKIEIKKDNNPVMTVSCDSIRVEYIYPEVPVAAMKKDLDSELVISQLSKTGGTPFEFAEIETDIDSGLYMGAGELNKIRREALELFEKAYLDSFKRQESMVEYKPLSIKKTESESGFVCEVTTMEHLQTVSKFEFEKFYVPINVIEKNRKFSDEYKSKIVIVLPAILRGNEFERFVIKTKELLDLGYHGVLVHNISLVESFNEYNIFGGFRLNIFNSIAMKEYADMSLKALELSPELTLNQIRNIDKSAPAQVMVYGRLPVVVSENCIIRNGSKCPCDGKNYVVDRMDMKFPVIKDCGICRSVILNCKKTFMAQDCEKLKTAGINFLRLYFTDEDRTECEKICRAFLEGYDYKPDDFTNGHFYKGVML